MLRKTACFIALIMLAQLTGCWDNRPVSDLSIAAGIGIDKSADGKIEITIQIIDKSGSQQSMSDSGSSKSVSSTVNVSATGSTMIEAVNNLTPRLGKIPFFSHIQLMAIGENAAKEGLDQIWDFFGRDHEMGWNIRVVVVKNGTAKSVLEAKAETEQISALQVAQAIDTTSYGKNVLILPFKVSELLSQPLSGIVAGVIDPGEAKSLKEMKVEGGAVFKHGKLIGYLDKDESRGYLFASDEIENTILTINNPKEDGKLVSIKIIRSAGKLTAKFINGKPMLGIEITAVGSFGDEQGVGDLTDNEDISELQLESKALIEDNIRGMLKKSQKEFNCDILNFIGLLYKHDYSKYKKIKNEWDKLYSEADIKIKVDVSIVSPGVIKKPAINK